MTTLEVQLLASTFTEQISGLGDKIDKLDERSRAIEQELAERRGADQKAGSIGRLVFGVAGMAAAISAVVAFILSQV